MVSNEVHAGIEFGSLNDLLGGGLQERQGGTEFVCKRSPGIRPTPGGSIQVAIGPPWFD